MNIADLMADHGIRPTANRILLAKALADASRPLSMGELELVLGSIDKSVISRTLTLFREHHLVHVIDSGADGVRYELCKSGHEDFDDDVHVHFYCEKCHTTYCMPDFPIPKVELPEGWESHSLTYLVKGICKECSNIKLF